MYNLTLRLVRDPQEAEDLAQEAFVRAWRSLPGFRAEASVRTWLYRIVTNLCYDRLPALQQQFTAIQPEEDVALGVLGFCAMIGAAVFAMLYFNRPIVKLSV